MIAISLPVTQASLFVDEDENRPPGIGWEHEDLLTPALQPQAVACGACVDAATGEVLFASTDWAEWLRQAAYFKARGYTLRHDSRPTGRLAPIVTS